MSVEGYVTDMLVRCEASDDLHAQVTAERGARIRHAESRDLDGSTFEDKLYEIRQHARDEHGDIERAVDWIEAHPQATEYEEEKHG